MNYFLSFLAGAPAQQQAMFADWQWILIFVIVVLILILALIDNTIQDDEHAVHGHADGETHGHDHHDIAVTAVAEAAPELEPEPEPAPTAGEAAEMELADIPDVEVTPAPEPIDALTSTEAETATETPDDLKIIEGIGPKVARLLNEAGYTTFAKLAAADTAALEALLAESKLQMMDPTSWPQQAQLAAEGRWEELERFQDALKGGRAAN